MIETAPVPLNNLDPTLQGPVAVPYETERGTAYNALNIRTGEALTPPSGISVEIYDEWAAEEVSIELNILDRFLAGEQIETEPGEVLSATSILEGLSNLAMLHIDQEKVDAIDSFVQSYGPGDLDRGWRWEAGKVADTVAESQIRILSSLMPGNAPLKHFTAMGLPLLRSGALKPKAGHDEYRSSSGSNNLLKSQGENAVRQRVTKLVADREAERSLQADPNLRFRDYPNEMGLHSQLVHFGESSVVYPASDTTTLYYPRSKVIDRTPIVMVGQDASGSVGVAGVVHGGDEANHGKSGQAAIRDRFARVHVDVTPELQGAISRRRESFDVTFMAATDSAETAVDFEYPIEDAVVFVAGPDIRKLVEDTVGSDKDDTLFPKSVMEGFMHGFDEEQGLKKDSLDLEKFTSTARRLKEIYDRGGIPEFKSPSSETFWRKIIEGVKTLEAEVMSAGHTIEKPDQILITQTVLLRRVLSFLGHDESWVNHNVFATTNSTDAVSYSEYAVRTASEWIRSHGRDVDYIQARGEKLEFDQLDLATQLPVYKS